MFVWGATVTSLLAVSDVVPPLVAVHLYSRSHASFGRRLMLSHPCLQYNCISLGLAVAAAAAIIEKQEVLGSVLFCLSLNHKQASLPL